MEKFHAPPLLPPTAASLTEAARVIRNGGVVAFPTETYYGLAVDPENRAALARLFRIKRRPPGKAVLVLAENRSQLSSLIKDIPRIYNPLMELFWPGPLTLVFPGRDHLSFLLTGNTATVGIRISSHPLAGRLVAAVGRPVTATSANISGESPAVRAHEVAAQFGRGVDLVLDGGTTPGGAGSTVVGCDATGRPYLIRAGVVPFAEVVAALAALAE